MPNYAHKIDKKREKKEEESLEDFLEEMLPCKYRDSKFFGGVIIGMGQRIELGICSHVETAKVAFANNAAPGLYLCTGEEPYPEWCPLKENKKKEVK